MEGSETMSPIIRPVVGAGGEVGAGFGEEEHIKSSVIKLVLGAVDLTCRSALLTIVLLILDCSNIQVYLIHRSASEIKIQYNSHTIR